MKYSITEMCAQKRFDLLNRHFARIIDLELGTRPEDLDENRFPADLPARIAEEYKDFMAGILAEVAPHKDIDAILDKRHTYHLSLAYYRKEIQLAYKDAKTINLWEMITTSNHEDVISYVKLLNQYTVELLKWMEVDFLEDIR